MKRQIDTLTPDHDLLVAKARLHWQLMGERRKAISAIELCIRTLTGLRPTLGRAAVDPLVRDYRSALRFFASIGADAMPCRDQLDDYQRRMTDLHQRLVELKEPLDYNRRSNYIIDERHQEHSLQLRPTFKEK